jgi:glycosyltransferase involved in cell wall biosynthesis
VTYAPGDLGALADALQALAGDRGRLQELGRRGRELAVERFNAEAQIPALRAAWAL